MTGIWTGNAIIAAGFVIYWLCKYPELQKESLMFRGCGLGETLVSAVTWFFYILAASMPFAIWAMAMDINPHPCG